jgi:predicted alpha/beta superfamily hydrolase
MRHFVLSLVTLLVVASIATAGEPITIGETIKIESKILSEERTILVSTPADYGQSTQRYPVLYLTDGDGHLTHTRGTVDFLVRNGLMPDVIIVGVTNTDRTRDLTPTKATMTEDDGTAREFPTSGGAGLFLDFFEGELFPYIESNYRTQPYRIFSGHSFGGLFALNAFFTRPALFQAVLAVSPSLRWDDAIPLRQAKSFVEGREKQNSALFVAMANELEDDPKPDLLDQLESTIEEANIEGLQFKVMRMPDETHGSVVLRAHYWGLRDLFAGWQLPRDPETGRFTGGVDGIKKHYAGLSKRFGINIIPPENQVNGVGYQALGRPDIEGAIEVFRYNAALYPASANVHDSLGEALEQAGRLEEALEQYSLAVKNAKNNEDARLSIFAINRDRLKAQLNEAAPE